jgi:hypothetical protein
MAPVALVLTTHLLMQQVGWRHQRPVTAGHQIGIGRPQPDTRAATGGHEPARPDPVAEAAKPEPDPQTQARRVYQQHQAVGANLSGADMARRLGVSERHGRRLLAELRAEDEGSTRRNGDGAARYQQGGPIRR